MALDGKQLKAASVPPSALVKDSLAVVLGATQTVSTTTLANVAGLSFNLKANASYFFIWQVVISQATSASTNGLAVQYSGTFSRLAANAFMINSLTAGTYRFQTTNSTVMLQAATQAAATTLPITLVGTITTTSAGTLNIQAQRSTATTTILLGSGGHITQV
jgi:hypothetical protein